MFCIFLIYCGEVSTVLALIVWSRHPCNGGELFSTMYCNNVGREHPTY